MHVQSPKTSGNRNRVSGFLRLFVFSLLTAAFAFTSLHAQTVAYVTNSRANSVSVIDTSTNTLTATIPVGSNPLGVVLTPDGTRAFVTNFNDGTISVIDTASNTVAATISIGGPGFPAITPDGKRVYVPNGSGTVVIDTATNSVVTTISQNDAVDVAISPDGSRAYILSFNNLAVVDTATNTVVQTIGVSSDLALFPVPNLAITPDGGSVYVSGELIARVQAISTASNSVVATVPIPGTFVVFGLAVSPDGSRVYVSGTTANSVSIIDTATNTLEPATIPVGSFPVGVAVTPDGAFVYVANGGSNNVSVISTASNTVVATVPVGAGPQGIAIASLSTPFSNLTIKGLTVTPNGFAENGTFSLGAGSSGIDLAHQSFTVTVDGFSLTIPGGSFKQVGGNMHFVFNATINGTPVSVNLMATGGTSTDFKYSLSVTGVDLTGQPNPATVGLKIGSNSGTTTAPF